MDLTSQIIGIESGGNPSARNPRSSAAGLGQFIDATWLDMMATHRPDLVQGKSREEVLALKMDPDLSRAMTDAYAAQNANTLTQKGFQATPGNTYLAHFAGPQGAVKVLGADPAMPVAEILGMGVVKANPFLANMTAGDLQAWANRKMGGGAPAAPPPPPASQQQPAPPAQMAGFSLPQQQQSAPAQAAQMPEMPPMEMIGFKRPDFKKLQQKFGRA